MRANAKPAAAPGDGAPGSGYPALIKMSNQHTKRGQARAVEPAQTKLDNQHSTHPMPVRGGHCAHPLWTALSPLGHG
eukprot:scaffold11027_cov63-Phaeocystis_antarctica.AAC.1